MEDEKLLFLAQQLMISILIAFSPYGVDRVFSLNIMTQVSRYHHLTITLFPFPICVPYYPNKN